MTNKDRRTSLRQSSFQKLKANFQHQKQGLLLFYFNKQTFEVYNKKISGAITYNNTPLLQHEQCRKSLYRKNCQLAWLYLINDG